MLTRETERTVNHCLGEYRNQGFTLLRPCECETDGGLTLYHEGEEIAHLTIYNTPVELQNLCCQHLNEQHNEEISL